MREFEEKQCPYCLEYIPPRALVCKVCRQPLVTTLPDLAMAEARAAKMRERRHLNLSLADLDLSEFEVALPKVRRRAATIPAE